MFDSACHKVQEKVLNLLYCMVDVRNRNSKFTKVLAPAYPFTFWSWGGGWGAL